MAEVSRHVWHVKYVAFQVAHSNLETSSRIFCHQRLELLLLRTQFRILVGGMGRNVPPSSIPDFSNDLQYKQIMLWLVLGQAQNHASQRLLKFGWK